VGERSIVRLDAGFEAALGVFLVVAAAAGWLGAEDFASPATAGLVAAFGVVVLALAAWLFRLTATGEVTPGELTLLAAGNAVTALAGAVWGLAGHGFSTLGGVVVAVTVAALTALAVAQGLLLTRRGTAAGADRA
jgi:hypothetical protein